jgi:hypothetical protein
MRKLYADPDLVKDIYDATVRGESSTAIARLLTSKDRPVTASKVSSIWTAYDGKDAFIAEVKRRLDAGESVVDEPEKKPPLLTDDELPRLARLLRRMEWGHALCQLRPEGNVPPVGTAQKYIKAKFGDTIKFYETYPE